MEVLLVIINNLNYRKYPHLDGIVVVFSGHFTGMVEIPKPCEVLLHTSGFLSSFQF